MTFDPPEGGGQRSYEAPAGIFCACHEVSFHNVDTAHAHSCLHCETFSHRRESSSGEPTVSFSYRKRKLDAAMRHMEMSWLFFVELMILLVKFEQAESQGKQLYKNELNAKLISSRP